MYGSRLFKYIASPKLLAQLVVEIPSNQLCEVFVNFSFIDILKNFTLEQRLNLIENTKCKHPEAYMPGPDDIWLWNYCRGKNRKKQIWQTLITYSRFNIFPPTKKRPAILITKTTNKSYKLHTISYSRMCSRIQRLNIQNEIIRIIDALRRLNHALDDVPQADSAA